jgi:hypothetical protein
MNCGFCGRIVPSGQPICDGCRKARNRSGVRKQRKFDRQDRIERAIRGEEEVKEEDASAVWARDV